jgi:hypothetical protein
MMKKFLVLALVLAVAGLANASLSGVFAGGKISVSDNADAIGGVNACIGIKDLSAPLANSTLVTDLGIVYRTGSAPAAPNAAPAVYLYSGADIQNPEIWGLPYNAGLINVVWGDPVLTANPAGFWFSMPFATQLIEVTADKATLQIDITDGSGAVAQSIFLGVPEPMTMLLLGLGGLFLRKK